MSDVGDNIEAGRASWTFGGKVSETFPQHVRRSVPLYEIGHDLICKLSDFFLGNNSVCYDIGCSIGELTLKLAEHNKNKKGIRFIGIDSEENMVKKAEENREKNGFKNVEFICGDVLLHEYEKADMIVSNYTIQFIRPSLRQDVFNLIYENLNWGGAFVLGEKVRAPDARFQDLVTSVYTDFKIDNGFSESEIISKAQSLKGVLEPFSTQGNIDLMQRSGFVDIMTVMKYVCFETFLAIK